ncbi:MAG TPA: 16S rRNA (guanine(527)-N(7))-methyltransferase RsmG [Fimbriimonadaceae bacterium]|nr:16S rRNA (guanine(527)-N(7))-methyltransferase RsmG [Fimbriimonadaceae bacterium]
MDLSALASFCSSAGLVLDEEREEQTVRFLEGLYRLNETMNLTRVKKADAVVRHVVDSLLVAEFLPNGARVLDVGTGPGFPAWPLACYRPDLRVTALDSSGKMLRALTLVPLSNLEVVQGRAEECADREGFDAVTGRAVAPLGVQMEISAPWCRVGGRVVPFRTPNDREAVEGFDASVLGLRLTSLEERELPGVGAVRLFPIYEKSRRTPREYPRTWAQIKGKPLG